MLAGEFETRLAAARMPVIQPHWMPTHVQPYVAGEGPRCILQRLADHPDVMQKQHRARVVHDCEGVFAGLRGVKVTFKSDAKRLAAGSQ